MAALRNQFTLRINPIANAKIKKIAQAENRSTTNMIECLILDKIRRYEAEHGEILLTDEEVYPES